MQKVVIEKPYRFIPPHRGTWWPWWIQRLRLVDFYLRRYAGVVQHEVRHAERLQKSLDAGHGILLTPNHSRPDDPVVLAFLARVCHTPMYAMASWHLFHQSAFTAWAIRKMGAFSLYREGLDKQALQTAVDIIVQAERPLVLFPEGAVTRTNDRLQAMLEGVAFIARTAARKAAQATPPRDVVIHPVAIKYLFQGDLNRALGPVLTEIEQRLSWHPRQTEPLMERIRGVGFALLALKELEYFGQPQPGTLPERLQGLVNRLLQPLETRWLGSPREGAVVPRVKELRTKILPDLINGSITEQDRAERWRHLADIYLAQQVASYPPDYLTDQPSTDRLLETVERYEEDLTDKLRVHGNLKAVIEVGEPIQVPKERERRSDSDPIMNQLAVQLQSMLDQLARESRPWP
ncbi:MAG: 1-acyl-sn-glycerol-3-phosphate acyltransferase [Pirellulales bacterium]